MESGLEGFGYVLRFGEGNGKWFLFGYFYVWESIVYDVELEFKRYVSAGEM